MADFNTNFKVNPPFRTQEDLDALWEGLEDGTIDAIASDHNPQDEESKKLEFDMAEFGVIGLETLFAAINTFNEKISLEELIEKIIDINEDLKYKGRFSENIFLSLFKKNYKKIKYFGKYKEKKRVNKVVN